MSVGLGFQRAVVGTLNNPAITKQAMQGARSHGLRLSTRAPGVDAVFAPGGPAARNG